MSEIDEGQIAKDILDNEVFRNAIQEVREFLMDAIISSTSSDQDFREECYRELHGLTAVLTRLRAKMQAGVIKLKEQ